MLKILFKLISSNRKTTVVNAMGMRDEVRAYAMNLSQYLLQSPPAW